jgi:hypothetical protein
MKYLLCLSIIFAAGCSSLSKEECQAANWTEKGKSDAMRGIDSPKHTTYKKDCSEHGFNVNEKEYLSGYNQGLELYCNYQNGYNLGKIGHGSHLYCEKISTDFKKGLKVGRAEYTKIEKMKEERKKLKEQLISMNGGKVCPHSNVCKKEGVCDYNNRCSNNGKYCTFSGDCVASIPCISVSGYTKSQEQVSVKICPATQTY